MPAYIIASLTIHDREEMKKYTAAVPAAIKHYGGRYLCRGAEANELEGGLSVPIGHNPGISDA